MNKTSIAWADYTWNPITGCDPVSVGCDNCYAKAIHDRFYKGDFNLKIHQDRFNEPKKLKKSSVIFVCSMSDFFHVRINTSTIVDLLCVMASCVHHKFLILTKRPENIRNVSYPPNVAVGVSVCNSEELYKINILKEFKFEGSKPKLWVNFEPLISEIKDLSLLNGIDWVASGGESGRNARYCNPDWLISIGSFCNMNNIPYYLKQWGTNPESKKQLHDCFSGDLYNYSEALSWE